MLIIKGELVGSKVGTTSKGTEFVKQTILSRSSDGNVGMLTVYDYNGRTRSLKAGQQVEIEAWCTAFVIKGRENEAQVKYVAICGNVAGTNSTGSGRSLGVAV